jgi:hypothetical protein
LAIAADVAVTIDGEISAADLNLIANATTGVVTATIDPATALTDATVTALGAVGAADVITLESTELTADATGLVALAAKVDTLDVTTVTTVNGNLVDLLVVLDSPSLSLTSLVTINSSDAVTIDVARADSLRSAGIKFAADDVVSISGTGTALASLVFANYEVADLGGSAITLNASGNNAVNLTTTSANSLKAAGLNFAADDVITLSGTGAALGTLEFSEFTTTALGGASVVLDSSSNTVSLTITQANALKAAGLKFAADDAITLTGASADLLGLTFADYETADLGGASISLDATDAVTLSSTAAESLRTAGLKFAADDVITVGDTGTTLAGLTFSNFTTTALGGASVTLNASDNAVTLTVAQADALLATAGLKFASNDVITLTGTGTALAALTFANYATSALGGASVVLDASDAVVLTVAQADSLVASGPKFATGDSISVTGLGADLANLSFASYATTTLGGASVVIDASDNAVTLTSARATSLLSAGLTFAATDTVTVTGSGGADTLNLTNSVSLGTMVISGLAGKDTITSGSTGDVLIGGANADVLTGGGGNDTFVFASRAHTRESTFFLSDTNAANLDRITDFGTGDDTIQLGVAANVFGAALTFAVDTTANVTAVTLNNQADFELTDTLFNVASVTGQGGQAEIVDVTLTGTGLAAAGVTRLLVILDNVAGSTITLNDTIINITGITGALQASDFTFA